MGETANIMQMAEFLSDDVFSEFFWEKIGPTNHNWPCENEENHNVDTHPSDVVFWYDEPYSNSRTYVNCDLKSYASGSIKSSIIKGAIESLAKQTSCAEVSDEWQKLHTHPSKNANICSLLFVYNHDGKYDKDFSKSLNTIDSGAIDIPKGSKIVVLGPEDVFWLDNVRMEIRHMRGGTGDDKLPDPKYYKFFYPQLDRKANVQLENARAATLEMLTSSMVIIEYTKPHDENKKGIVIFYRKSGDTTYEFTYILDYLRHYQLLKEEVEVQIRLLRPAPHAKAMFQQAVQMYTELLIGKDIHNPLEKLVKAIKFRSMNQIRTEFSSLEIGMDYE